MSPKKSIREAAIAQRQALSPEEVESLGAEVIRRLIKTIPWQDLHIVHIFLSCAQRKEINTRPLLEYLWREHPRLITLTNRLHQDHIACHLITAETPLEKSNFGILEPAENTMVWNPAKIDLMILPLLACDTKGFRIGYGKGYYDRLLTQCPKTQRVGINYFPPLEAAIPHEAHDELLHRLITPERDYFMERLALLQG